MSQGTKQAAGAQLYKGIFFIILSSFCFAVMNLFVSMAGDVPAMAGAFRQAIEAGRTAYLTGMGRVLARGGSASDPLTGFLR